MGNVKKTQKVHGRKKLHLSAKRRSRKKAKRGERAVSSRRNVSRNSPSASENPVPIQINVEEELTFDLPSAVTPLQEYDCSSPVNENGDFIPTAVSTAFGEITSERSLQDHDYFSSILDNEDFVLNESPTAFGEITSERSLQDHDYCSSILDNEDFVLNESPTAFGEITSERSLQDHDYCSSILDNEDFVLNESPTAFGEITSERSLQGHDYTSHITEHVPQGRRIVNVQHLFKQIQNIGKHPPFDCSISDMVVIKEQRDGLFSSFKLKCKMCGLVSDINFEDQENFPLNSAAVVSSISTGVGYSTVEEILSVLDMPFMAPRTYQKHHQEVKEKIHETLWNLMEEAGKEEVALAHNENHVDAEGIPWITVVADGAWSKRSYNINYNASSGVACIIGYNTKKILYLGIKNKYCCVCARAEAQSNSVGEHICYKNWNGPSTAIEADVIVDGFKHSLEMHGLKYTRLVGDGDSSVTRKLQESRPYGSTMVQKIECSNHLLRNFSKKINCIVERAKSISRNLPVSSNLRNVVANNALRLRRDIRKATLYRISEQTSFSDKINLLSGDILNAPSHVFGEHKNCKEIGYFLCNPNQEEVNYVPEMKAYGLFQDVEALLQRLHSNASSLISNMNNNIAEQYNAIVCKFVGGKRVNFSLRGSYETRCEAAAISFNTGGEYHKVMHKALVNESPRGFTQKYIQKIKKRIERQKEIRKAKKRLFKPRRNAPADEHYGVDPTDVLPDMTSEMFRQKKEKFLNELHKNPSEISKLELATRGQDGNPLWQQERSIRLTASNFGRICKMRQKTSCVNVVYNLLYGNFKGNKYTRYGKTHEPLAIAQFQEEFGLEVNSCGFFVDPNLPFLGASPDGLVGNNSILEVKCPATASELTPEEAVKEKKIKFAKITNGQLELNQNHIYYFQIQGQLHITGRSMCYFIVWTPKGMMVEKIERNDVFWKEPMEPRLITFYESCLLPEIIDPRYSRRRQKMDIRNPPRTPTGPQ